MFFFSLQTCKVFRLHHQNYTNHALWNIISYTDYTLNSIIPKLNYNIVEIRDLKIPQTNLQVVAHTRNNDCWFQHVNFTWILMFFYVNFARPFPAQQTWASSRGISFIATHIGKINRALFSFVINKRGRTEARGSSSLRKAATIKSADCFSTRKTIVARG